MKTRMCVSIVILASFLSAHADVPERVDGVHDSVQQFLAPVNISHDGLREFFTTIFNKDRYVQEILPACFAHVVDFLDYAKNVKNPRAYTLSVLEIFHQRIKGTPWINAFALLVFLEQVPRLLGDVCSSQKATVQGKKDLIKACLYDALLARFSELKEDPESFITTLSTDIADDLDVEYAKEKQAMLEVQELRLCVSRYLEGALDKLIWSAKDGRDVWSCVKALCQNLELCLDYKILPDTKTLNALVWSVLYRFGYFIHCAGSQLDVRCYHDIKSDIAQGSCSFLLLEEPERAMTSKTEYLLSCVKEGEIKSHAYKQGILSDAIL